MANGSLSSKVYEKILQRLLNGAMKPGQVFNRRQMAAELGVSVAPVLEAMLELQAEGLIETVPRQGTRVRALTVEDLQGQLIVREALECQAARLYCGPTIERHMKRLMVLAKRIDASELSSPQHLKEEVRFHHFLVSLAGVPGLTAAYERVMKLGLFYTVQVLHPDQAAAPRSNHLELLEGLKTGSPDEAEAIMRAHAQAGKEVFFAPLKQRSPRPSPNSPSWLSGSSAPRKVTPSARERGSNRGG
jgi:DNA-binding GntR family transcriptional regulator